VAGRLTGLFSTHPSIDDRVEALQRYAGAMQAGTDAAAPAP
jgi:Zn-dependent protease with chaperone function